MFHRKFGVMVPMKLRDSNSLERSGGFVTDGAVDEDGGVQVGLGHADLGALGRHLALGAADIGAAAEQVGRNARGDPGRHGRQRLGVQLRPRTELRLQIARRDAQQDTERVVRLTEHDLEGRDGRAGLFQDGPGLFHVEPGRRADPELLLDEGQDALLNPDVVAGDLDPLLGDPVLHVIRGHVGQQGHQGGIVVFDRSIQVGIGGLDRAAETAPEIELPAQVEAGRPVGIEVADG